MTATQQFIEDAIKGGWNNRMCLAKDWVAGDRYFEVLLDALAWQAVGKTRGWSDEYEKVFPDDSGYFREMWYNRWCMFISELADGKTIEESLSALS